MPAGSAHASADHNLAALLSRAARRWPRLPAVARGTRAMWDYAAFASRVSRLASVFASSGLRAGDRIAIVSSNVPEYVEALFACWWAGLVAVPINAKLHPSELAFVLADSGARWAMVDQAWRSAISDALHDAPAIERIVTLGESAYDASIADAAAMPIEAVAPDAGAWLFYTSGTTGRPKGVVISHANLRAMTQCFLSDVETIAPGDAILHAAPLSHGSGLYAIPHFARGATNVLPESAGFDAAEIVSLIDAWSRALFFAAPTMVKRLVATPALGTANVDRLKCIVYGGGPMYVEDCKSAFAAFGPRLAQIYGQGETPMTITAMDRATLADAMARNDDARIASVGIAQSGMEVRIGDAEDRSLPAGAIGEVLVRGPTVMQGYWRNPDATAKTLAGGWLHTGDVGTFDADGYLTLKDRSKDLIISGGSNIYPREVEEALLSHAAVAEVAIVGRPHPDWGEEVVAFVVARNAIVDDAARAALERELDRHCLERIARFKRPKAYLFVGELPKNNTGKIIKTALREKLRSSSSAATRAD